MNQNPPSASLHLVIPARMGSQRFPGKPLAELGDSCLIVQVLRRARETGIGSIIVATDDQAIADVVRAEQGDVVMTRSDHASGTDRLAEVAETRGWDDADIVVNLQGDEPLMPPECIHQVAELLPDNSQAAAASLYRTLQDPNEIADPNTVKVVCDGEDRALYFSRAAIPYPRQRDGDAMEAVRGHLGLYGYRVATLRWFAEAPVSGLEATEGLEQLRLLVAGKTIQMAAAVCGIPGGVDTREDLARIQHLFAS